MAAMGDDTAVNAFAFSPAWLLMGISILALSQVRRVVSYVLTRYNRKFRGLSLEKQLYVAMQFIKFTLFTALLPTVIPFIMYDFVFPPNYWVLVPVLYTAVDIMDLFVMVNIKTSTLIHHSMVVGLAVCVFQGWMRNVTILYVYGYLSMLAGSIHLFMGLRYVADASWLPTLQRLRRILLVKYPLIIGANVGATAYILYATWETAGWGRYWYPISTLLWLFDDFWLVRWLYLHDIERYWGAPVHVIHIETPAKELNSKSLEAGQHVD
ncbi:hypothetical protein HDU86_000683 [Geranomyces michiganensis]|nr:hypothetical protein HDU86_000683 [Geranomyces michiganensis]